MDVKIFLRFFCAARRVFLRGEASFSPQAQAFAAAAPGSGTSAQDEFELEFEFESGG